MKKTSLYICSIGVAATILLSAILISASRANARTLGLEAIVQRLEGQQQEPPSPPPPPPAGTGMGSITESPVEKPRIFVGPTRAQVQRVERALPRGSSVYIGPVGVEYETAAIAEADVDGDGVAETVVVHTQRKATNSEPRPTLMLSILSRQANQYFVRMSISLVGSILFNIETNEGLLPVVVQDITGDGRFEIVGAPGPSASLGGWLEVYDISFHICPTLHQHGLSELTGME